MRQPICPYCQQNENVVKAGFNPGGSQRFRCYNCRKYFTPQPSPRGLDPALHQQALKLYLEGTSFRAIGRLLNVHHQSVINWINAQAANLPPQVSDTVPTETIEIDELFTFIGSKKKKSI
jgi:transposase-like protein